MSFFGRLFGSSSSKPAVSLPQISLPTLGYSGPVTGINYNIAPLPATNRNLTARLSLNRLKNAKTAVKPFYINADVVGEGIEPFHGRFYGKNDANAVSSYRAVAKTMKNKKSRNNAAAAAAVKKAQNAAAAAEKKIQNNAAAARLYAEAQKKKAAQNAAKAAARQQLINAGVPVPWTLQESSGYKVGSLPSLFGKRTATAVAPASAPANALAPVTPANVSLFEPAAASATPESLNAILAEAEAEAEAKRRAGPPGGSPPESPYVPPVIPGVGGRRKTLKVRKTRVSKRKASKSRAGRR